MVTGRRLVSRALGLSLAGCLLVAWCAFAGHPADGGEPAPETITADDLSDNGGGGGTTDQPTVVLESKPLSRIKPGTVIGKEAPEGWSHLVMIAIPTLTKEDLRD